MGEPICSTTIPHINSETNPPSPIINVVCKYLRQFLATSSGVGALLIYYNNVVCKYLRQFLGTSFGVATLPINCNNELGESLIHFCKVENSRIFRNFSRNWVGLNNLCGILYFFDSCNFLLSFLQFYDQKFAIT